MYINDDHKKKIDILKENTKLIFKDYPIKKAWVFGSFARNEETSNSDIDILVEYQEDYLEKEGTKFSIFELVKLKQKLEKSTGKSIDITDEKKIKKRFRPFIIHDRILIFENSKLNGKKIKP